MGGSKNRLIIASHEYYIVINKINISISYFLDVKFSAESF